MSETPDILYGRLLESAHVSGYTFERLCQWLDPLITDGAWRTVGGGFDTPEAFLRSIDLTPFDLGKYRPALVRKIKAATEASNRAIAQAVGVHHSTVAADLAEIRQPAERDNMPTSDSVNLVAGDSPPDSGRIAAQRHKAREERKKRDLQAADRRAQHSREQAEQIDAGTTIDIRQGDFRDALADLHGIDAIITDPPYPREYLHLLGDLADWSDKALAPDGVLAVLLGQFWLPEAYRLLSRGRPYRWTACYLTPGSGYSSMNRRVQANWKPLLIYGGGPRLGDVIRADVQPGTAKIDHKWGQDYGAFQTIVERLTTPGQTVADPFMGSGTTLLAAKALGRHAIGCDIDAAAVATARERVA